MMSKQAPVTLKILFVDDDPDELMIFEDAVSEMDYDYSVTHVRNCEELEKYLAEGETLPDAVFLDINMPGLNGMDCLRIVRERTEYDGIPIFMYSTSANRRHIEQSRESGADLYIVKQSSFEKTKAIFKTIFATLSHPALGGLKEKFLIP